MARLGKLEDGLSTHERIPLSILAQQLRQAREGMLAETMRPPTNIFFTMLLGIVALLFGFGIAAVISGTLRDMLADFGEAARSLVH